MVTPTKRGGACDAPFPWEDSGVGSYSPRSSTGPQSTHGARQAWPGSPNIPNQAPAKTDKGPA